MLYLRHIRHQRRALAALGATAWREWRRPPSSSPPSRRPLPTESGDGDGQIERRADSRAASLPFALPGPELTARVSAPSAGLVRDYLLHVGGDPAAYRGVLPPHLFLHWSLPLAARTLRNLPYPLLRIVNAGCRIQVNAPLPAGATLSLRARLFGVDANQRRAVLHQRIVTGSDGAPDALVADLYTVVPATASAARNGAPARDRDANNVAVAASPPRADTRVPDGARELGRWSLLRMRARLY